MRLELADPVIASQNRALTLVVRRTSAGVRIAGKTGAAPRVAMDVGRFAQVYTGSERATELLSAGLVDGDRDAAALLDEWFAAPRLFLGPLNGF
jgi:hypothetical protein